LLCPPIYMWKQPAREFVGYYSGRKIVEYSI